MVDIQMEPNVKNSTQSAGMIVRLNRLSYSQGFVCGLTATQWTALRYFAKANKNSRTLLAFADYHATTRGTASQTVQILVAQGILKRTRSKTDGRVSHIDLTARGRVIIGQDPFVDLAECRT